MTGAGPDNIQSGAEGTEFVSALKKPRLKGILTTAHNYQEEHRTRTRGIWCKLEHGKLWLDTRKFCLTVRVVKS